MENDFLQTLIGQMSMAFSLARSSSGSGATAATAAQSSQELGMCLESMGVTRIDAVLVAIERCTIDLHLKQFAVSFTATQHHNQLVHYST